MLAADYIETCTQTCPLHSFERSLRASALGNTSSFVTLAAVAQKLFQCFSVSCSLRRTQSCRVKPGTAHVGCSFGSFSSYGR